MERTVEVGLYIAAAALFVLGCYTLYLDRTASGTVALVGGLACLFVSKLDLVEQIELFALKATMRRTITEAQATVSQLHSLAATQSAVIVRLVATGGWWEGGHSREDKAKLKQSVLTTLRELGLPEEQVKKVDGADAEFIGYEYVTHLKRAEIFARDHAQDQSKWTEFFNRTINRAISDQPRPAEFEAVFRSLERQVPEAVWELLNDYRHYVERGVHRRPEAFYSRYPGVFPNNAG